MNKQPYILVVDDEISIIESFKLLLDETKYKVEGVQSGEEAIKKVISEEVNLILLDIRLPGIDGIKVLERVKSIDKNMEVIMITATKTIKSAVEAMRLGAYDYVNKPFNVEEIRVIIEKALEKHNLTKEVNYLKATKEEERPLAFESIVAKSSKMHQIFEFMTQICQNDATILITGESGTGKELISRAIHSNSLRKGKSFIAVNCAAIPENLLESEFFGHEKGAFTGAITTKIGKFELANEGTLFLDEISCLKYDIQAKLLRVLQEREFERVGGEKLIRTNARIISATNTNLKKAVEEGRFREDLYYRLNVIPIELPPLRDRKEDIPLLIEYFIKYFNEKFNKDIKGISGQAVDILMNYSWPGNVRELNNIIERMIVLSKEKSLQVHQLPLDILVAGEEEIKVKKDLFLKEAKESFEKQYILNILKKNNFNQTKTAKLLGIHRTTLIEKINSLGIKNKADSSY
ncbi:sigma-54 dependent transcriptional regulator [bacterium]|nr:sigma-54 dependent transcriptional regulator [bacterium]MBU1152578.1 sigma-54 dependent transcriptional regulator [bacterium]